MKFITISELRASASHIVAEVEESGEVVIVTKNGKPVVLMRPVSEDEFELKAKEVQHGKDQGVV